MSDGTRSGLAQCNCCYRVTWARDGKHCGMPLPNGLDCYGRYVVAPADEGEPDA